VDFSFERLRPNERVVWSGTLEKMQRDKTTKPAPPIREESKPRMCRQPQVRDECSNIGEFHLNNQHVIRALREKWGVK
jgi:hypothetical protein